MADNGQRLSPEETLYPNQATAKEPNKPTAPTERHLSMEETLYPDMKADRSAADEAEPKAAEEPVSTTAGPPEAYKLIPP